MGRETKFGLLVGLVFIVLFGVILMGRANTSTEDHATLPTGESRGHEAMAHALNRNVDPFMGGGASLDTGAGRPTPAGSAVEPVSPTPAPEEPLRAPADIAAVDTPPARPADTGTVAFGPTTIETPMGREYTGSRTGRGDEIAMRLPAQPPVSPVVPPAGPTPADPAAAARATHVVKSGDTLTSIARQYFGKDGDRMWQKILEANKAAIKDGNRLAVGQKLVIPGLPVEPRRDAPAIEPRREAPRRDVPSAVPDTAIAAGGRTAPAAPAPRTNAVIDALRPLTVPADSPRGPAVRETPRDVNSRDLGRMMGNQSDLIEAPAKPPATYTVQAGDNFASIARKMYGDGKYGRLLFLKNQHLVPDEKKMKVGQRIVLLDGMDKAPASGVNPASDTAVATSRRPAIAM